MSNLLQVKQTFCHFVAKRLGLLAWLLLANMGVALAQNRTVEGTVTNKEDGSPLPGVNVVVKGTTSGTITDTQGKFKLNIPTSITNPRVVFSFVGMASQEVEVGSQTNLTVAMTADLQQLSEVVVTALGVEREKKALGYSVQEVQGSELVQARETNLVNSLSGKIAGVTIVGSPSGVGGSSRITIRGDKSLNLGNNQPLFVVDGVPISNDFNGNTGRGMLSADYGNGAAVVNPDDIEAISVLKGANAAALYGARANNGVILITTKSGRGTKGIGVSVNSNVTFDNVLRLPDYQNEYGQGLNGEFGFVDGNGGGLRDGVDEAWGPRMQGQPLAQFSSPTANGFRGGDIGDPRAGFAQRQADMAARGAITPTPFLNYSDNVRNFFETGVTLNNNVAVSGGNEFGDFRLSYTNLNQTGVVPNTDLRRNTLAFSGGYRLTKKLQVRTAINYIKGSSDNRPSLQYGTENIMYLFNCWLPRSIDLEAHRDYWQTGREGTQQFGWNYNYHDNPYFQLYENTNGQTYDRVFGNVLARYEFTDWLSLQVRSGTDFNNERRTRRRAFSTQRFPFGTYRVEDLFFEERNTDFLLNFNKTLDETWAVNATLGGNLMRQRRSDLDVSAPQLLIPGIYNFSNTRVELVSDEFRSERRINSVYGSAQIVYKNSIFLDLTARNDWSSTLPVGNNSYFYPSASLSAVVSDLVELPTVISFAKLRAGVAQVGNDTGPFQLTQPYFPGAPFGADRTFSESGQLANPDLKPEISTSVELGADLRFFNGRVGFDFAYYNITSRNQILAIPLSNTSGYTSRVLNAGRIQNWGYEATLNLKPIVSERGLNWDVDVNFSANRSKVLELTEGISNFVMASRYINVEARVDERMGAMYGIGYERVTDQNSPFFGQVINDSRGRPIANPNRILLGNYNPDWLAGIYNTFRYRGITVGFLLDLRYGGLVYSHTQTVGREGGMISETLEGRANGYDITQPGNGVIAPGVVRNADGSFRANDIRLTAREWHTAITNGRRIVEAMTYDATFLKLREFKIGYSLPNKLMGRLPFRDVNVSLVGRNVFLWTAVPHIDPETSTVTGDQIVPGVEDVAIPSTRSVGFNLSFRF
jgi:TonB-linked SusC/RagA family outer membrane protein